MNLKHCDNCGTQQEMGEAKWYAVWDETGDGEIPHSLPYGITRMTQRRYDLCSWKCVSAFAQLKVHEQEMSA